MVIGIFWKSYTGKYTLAENLATGLPCEVFAAKDHLRLAKKKILPR